MNRRPAFTTSALCIWILTLPLVLSGCARSIEGDETPQNAETTLVANETKLSAMDDIPLIPRDVLFGNPQRTGPGSAPTASGSASRRRSTACSTSGSPRSTICRRPTR